VLEKKDSLRGTKDSLFMPAEQLAMMMFNEMRRMYFMRQEMSEEMRDARGKQNTIDQMEQIITKIVFIRRHISDHLDRESAA
jgi:hypothetical protein